MPIAPCLQTNDPATSREGEARERLSALLRQLVQSALDAEAQAACQAGPFQRSPARLAHRAGGIHRRLPSPFGGELRLRLPRLDLAGHHTALLPLRTRSLDHLAGPLLRLAAGHNSWSAVQLLLTPLRELHGETPWLNRLAQRLLAHAEQGRRPPLPVVAEQLHIAAFSAPYAGAPPGLHRIQVVSGRCVTWFAAIPDASGWSRLAQSMREHGLLAIERIHGEPPPASIDALRRFWPSI